MSQINTKLPDSSLPTFEAYRIVFSKTPGNQLKNEAVLKNHYENNVRKAMEQLERHSFWIELRSEIENWDAEYRQKIPNVEALYGGGEFDQQAQIHCKEWLSALNKAYRKNVLNNPRWPESPEDGWVASDTWFLKLTDILRTTITSRYIDGVQFIADKLVVLAKKHSLPVRNQLQATVEGYYAGHVDISFDFVLDDLAFNDIQSVVSVEFQITTQLKQVVKELLHVFYEKNRISTIATDPKSVWQWDYSQPLFDANYLGHVVHYLEAQIFKVRERNNGS